MDTSKEYIKMCEKAEGIQKRCIPKEGDYIYDKQGKDVGINTYIGTPVVVIGSKVIKTEFNRYLLATKTNKHLFVWLPRQDQLQEMVGKETREYLYEFNEWLCDGGNVPQPDFYTMYPSMEQLWLAYVMSEKYNKTWNGKDWVKES